MAEPSSRARSFPWLSIPALVFLVLVSGTVRHDLPDSVERGSIIAVAGQHRFSLAIWEVGHLNKLVSGRWTGDVEVMNRYFELAAARRLQDLRVSRALALTGSSETPAAVQAREARERIAQEMESLEPGAAAAIHALVSETLAREGLTTDFPGFGHRLFPPFAFTMEELPRVLVVSPRDRIELLETVALRPDVPLEAMESIEEALAHRGLSAFVDRIGGIATYPSLVREDLDLRQTIATTAHEWAHGYLFFRPLGQRYGAGAAMKTIIETVANIIGNEIAASYFGEEPPSFTARLDPPRRETRGDRFDVAQYLRETRQQTDDLLAEGSIEEAEAFMERRRVELAANGVYIRKLNQAFFAFRGTYADSPVSVSPVFRQLTLLRRAEPSLRAFVDAVAGIRTPEDLSRLAAGLSGQPGVDPS